MGGFRFLAQEWNGVDWVTKAGFDQIVYAEEFVELVSDDTHHWRIKDEYETHSDTD